MERGGNICHRGRVLESRACGRGLQGTAHITKVLLVWQPGRMRSWCEQGMPQRGMTSLSACLIELLERCDGVDGFLSVQQRMVLVLCWGLQADGLDNVRHE